MYSPSFNTPSLSADGLRYASALIYTGKNAQLQALRMIDAGYFGGLQGEWTSANEKLPDDNNGYVMVYCTDGTAQYMVNNSCSRLTRHHFIIHSSGTDASYSVPAGATFSAYRVRFTGELAESLVAGIADGEVFSPGDILGTEMISRINEALTELERDSGIESQLYCSALLHYILGAMRRFTTKADTVSIYGGNSDKVVGMAIRYMKENLSKKLSLQELTEMTSYSKPHFMMMFKKATGHSPMGYFNCLKIMRACSLLDTTDMKINQICFAIGITDMFYFSRLFKKYMHISPSAYRTRNATTHKNDK